jgi:two-component system, cell cycle sensor histidine kinase and response regulator CckA
MKYRLQDLIDIRHFQELQDRLNEIYSFPSAIIDNDGNILTATAWQEICTNFHRKNKDAERLCLQSDQYIQDHLHEANPAVTYRCPHGLVDNATPITIDGVHYGNFFTGQFFLEEPDLEFFRDQAQKYGFDEQAYLEAVKKVPVWTKKQLDNYLYFIKGLIAVISESGLKNIKEIEHREQIQKSEEHYRSILKAAMDGYWLTDTKGRLLEVNDAYCRMSGYSENELLTMHIADLEALESPEMVAEHMRRLISKGSDRFESRHCRKNGTVFDVEISIKLRKEGGGQCVCFLRDITEHKQSEQKRKQLETQLINAIELAHLGPWEYDFQNDLFTFNDQFYKLFRTSVEQVGGYRLSSAEYATRFIHPEDRDLLKDETRKCIDTSDPNYNRQLEHRIVYADGQAGYISVRFFIKKDDQGVTVRSYGVNQDITERKMAYEELKQANEKMKLAADSACFGIWDYHSTENRLEWDDWMFRLYGVRRDTFRGAWEAWQAGVHPDERERVNEEVEQALRGEKEFDTQFRIILPNGQVRIIKAHASVTRDKTGSPMHMTGINYDITEQVHAVEALKESEERFKALHNASFGGITIHDKGLILECNKGLSDITGYDYVELIGMNGLELISEDTRNLVIKNIEAGFEKPYEAKGVRKNGEVYPLRLEARNIPFKGKNVRVVEFRDITENKRAEVEREDLEAKLRQAQKMESVGRLAGGVAHDFNNMLGVIIGHAEMAIEGVDRSSTIYASLKEIREAGERSADLTRQLLAFARKQTISPKVVDLNKTVQGMLSMLKRLIGEDIDLKWIPGKDMWPVRVDPSQIDQILANLCVNARDAIADVGKISIETATVELDETSCLDLPEVMPGEYVLLSVSDNGCGVDSDTLCKIFEPFFTTKQPSQGTGLGLATVYGAVKQNEGFIDVQSVVGQGTTFTIYFPRYRDKAETLKEDTKDLPTGRGHETILLVEDETAVLEMTKIMLERLGYKVLAAKEPAEAIRLAREHVGKIDLLLTDVVMPEMNGRDLAKNILSLYPHLKRLFVSGYTANIISPHGVLDEGVNFIQKPFSREQLGAKVRDVLDEDLYDLNR